MEYSNELPPMFQYNVVGEIAIPVLSVSSDNMLKWVGKRSALFYDPTGEGDYNDKITPYETAFSVKLVNGNGSVARSFVAVVTDIAEYTASPDGDDYDITLRFKYRNAAEKYAPVEIPDVPPVAAHIFGAGEFLGIIYEGNDYYIKKHYASTAKQFQHCGVLYYTQSINLMSMVLPDNIQTIDDPLYTIGVVVIASRNRVCDKIAMDNFSTKFRVFLDRAYGVK